MASSTGKLPPSIILRSVLTKTNNILISHRRHFISLTLLFILPISFISISTSKYLIHHQSLTTPVISIISSTVTFFLSLIAAGTVSFSAHQILSDRHVKLVTPIKSLKRSFFPLLITSLCSILIEFTVVIGFVFCVALILIGFRILGFQIAQILDPPITLIICVVLAIAIIIGLIMYFHVNFALSSVIATVEFSYGFESLRRSIYLVKGTRRVIVKLISTYQIIAGFFMLGVSFLRDDNGDTMKNWKFVFAIVMSVVVTMMITLHYLVAITVLYVYCKGVHGEFSGGEVSDDLAGEYISLPSVVPTV